MGQQATYSDYRFPREEKAADLQSRPAELPRYYGHSVLSKPRYSPTGTNTSPQAHGHRYMHTHAPVYAQAIRERVKHSSSDE